MENYGYRDNLWLAYENIIKWPCLIKKQRHEWACRTHLNDLIDLCMIEMPYQIKPMKGCYIEFLQGD